MQCRVTLRALHVCSKESPARWTCPVAEVWLPACHPRPLLHERWILGGACHGLQMGAKVVLGDRPVHVTIARLWAALSIFEKTRFIWQMLITGLLPDPKEISDTVESLKVS